MCFIREFWISEARHVNYRYTVVGDIAIRFLSILAQKCIVSYLELTYYILF